MSVFFMDFDMAPSVIWARDLYDQMQIRSDFRKWFPRMCQYGFVEGRDYEFVPRVRPQDEGGRTVQRYVKDYRITLEMAKQLYKLHHFHKNGCFHPCTEPNCRETLTVFDMFLRMFTKNVFKKRKSYHSMRDMDYSHPFEVPFGQGSFLVIRTDLWKSLNGFDDRFFMYLEDADLCRRVNENSKLMYCPDAIVIHKWEKESHRNKALFKVHIQSMIKYFNKWGWKLI